MPTRLKLQTQSPKLFPRNLYVQTAYNSRHQLQIAKEIAHLIEDNNDIKLIVINNLTKFFRDSRGERRLETASTVKEVISTINRACVKNKTSIVVTGDSNLSSKGVIARPIGGTYLKHIANVIVYLKNILASTYFQASELPLLSTSI